MQHNCHVCPEVFSQMNTLNCHTSTLTRVEAHDCSMCNQEFVWKNHLGYHRETRSPEKKQCNSNLYKKIVTQRDNIQLRMKIHLGNTPLPSKFCNEVFGRRTDYEHHLETHFGETLCQIELCQYLASDVEPRMHASVSYKRFSVRLISAELQIIETVLMKEFC